MHAERIQFLRALGRIRPRRGIAVGGSTQSTRHGRHKPAGGHRDLDVLRRIGHDFVRETVNVYPLCYVAVAGRNDLEIISMGTGIMQDLYILR